MTVEEFIKSRNDRIYMEFTIHKMRQKEIAKEMQLSESQVKHIIGAIRKEKNEQRATIPRTHTS